MAILCVLRETFSRRKAHSTERTGVRRRGKTGCGAEETGCGAEETGCRAQEKGGVEKRKRRVLSRRSVLWGHHR